MVTRHEAGPAGHIIHLPRVEHVWQAQALWVAGAALFGFAISGFLSSILGVERDVFVALYLLALVPFVWAWTRSSEIDVVGVLRRRWVAGLAVGVIVGAAMVFFVLRQQDASPRAQGAGFVWDILWLGVVYGLLDALLLNVLPVIAVWRASDDLGHTHSWRGKIATGAAALAASLVVTVAYHLGYAEYRGGDIGSPVFGNALMTLGYLLSTNPITAFIAHVALHVTSVIHGVDATVTLPPHY